MGVNFQIFFEVIRLEVELGIDADDHLAHVLEPLLDRRRKKLRGRAEDVIELDHELRDCHLPPVVGRASVEHKGHTQHVRHHHLCLSPFSP